MTENALANYFEGTPGATVQKLKHDAQLTKLKTTLETKYPDFLRMASLTINEGMDVLEIPKKAQNIMSSYWVYLGAPPKEMDFFTNAIMLWAYVELGAAVPSMKSHEISVACEKTIRDNGSEIWYNTEVKELIEKYAPKGEDYSVFMCGPQAMYNFVDKELEKLHLRRKFIRHELFGEMHNPEEQEEYPKDRTVPETVKITVIQEGEEKTVTGSTDDSLLQILEKNGIAALSHCRSGEYGWCHSRLVFGEVYAPTSVDGRREADKKFGYIHPCVSFPLTDMTIEVPNVR